MQIMDAPTNYQLKKIQQKLNLHDDLLTNGENFSQGNNPTGWF